MKRTLAPIASMIVFALAVGIRTSRAQTPAPTTKDHVGSQQQLLEYAPVRERRGSSLMSASGYGTTVPMATAPTTPVTGAGSIGWLTKWTGFASSNSVIGNSTIFEDKFGMVGIGTDMPASRLTVVGLIEATGTGSGIKYPDGTIQTTAFDPNQVVRSLNGLRGDLMLAAGPNITVTPSGGKTLTIAAPDVLTSVLHNASLVGNGTAASPLSIADSGVGTAQLANNAVTAAKIATGQVIKSLNGLSDQVTLSAGPNITITPNGNTLTIASAVSDPAINAFQAGFEIDLPDSGNPNFSDFEIQVPPNKRLVIEYLTLDLFADTGARISFSVTTHIGNGPNVEHNFPPIRVNDLGFATNQHVRIYADGSVAIRVLRLEPGGHPALGKISFSGHLVDLP